MATAQITSFILWALLQTFGPVTCHFRKKCVCFKGVHFIVIPWRFCPYRLKPSYSWGVVCAVQINEGAVIDRCYHNAKSIHVWLTETVAAVDGWKDGDGDGGAEGRRDGGRGRTGTDWHRLVIVLKQEMEKSGEKKIWSRNVQIISPLLRCPAVWTIICSTHVHWCPPSRQGAAAVTGSCETSRASCAAQTLKQLHCNVCNVGLS